MPFQPQELQALMAEVMKNQLEQFGLQCWPGKSFCQKICIWKRPRKKHHPLEPNSVATFTTCNIERNLSSGIFNIYF